MNLTLPLAQRYRIVKPLSERSSRPTLMVTESASGKQGVLKIFPLKARALIEKLSAHWHANIPPILEWGAFNRDLYLIQPFITGKPFLEYVRGKKPGVLADLMTQLSLTVDELHGWGIIHGDLKSENILVTPSGRIQLLDFDLSFEPIRKPASLPSGSLANLSPEVLRGSAKDHRTDIYALGILLSQALLPDYFKAFSADDWIEFHLKGNPPEALAEAYGATVRSCLSKKPGQRFQRAFEIAKRLNLLLQKPYDLKGKHPLYAAGDAELAAQIRDQLSLLEKGLRDKNPSLCSPETLRRLGDYEEILTRLEEGPTGQSPLRHQLLAIKARILIEKGQYKEALDTPCQTVDQKNAHGLAHYYLGSWERARELFLAALREAKSPLQKGSSLNYLGLTALRQNAWPAAEDFFLKADAIFKELKDPQPRASTLMNLAALHQTRGDYTQAYRAYELSLKLARRIQHPYLSANLLCNLANLYILFGAGKEASLLLQEAMDLAAGHQLPYWSAYGTLLKGDLEFLKEGFQKAQAFYQSALRQFESQKLKAEALIAKGNLFELCFYLKPDPSALKPWAHALDQKRLLDLLQGKKVPHKPEEGTEIILTRLRQKTGKPGDDAARLAQTLLNRLNAFLEQMPAEFRERALRHPRWKQLRQAAQEALKEDPVKIAHLTKLIQVTKRMSSELNLAKLLEFIMDAVIEISGAERGFLILKKSASADGDFFVDVARNIDLESIAKPQFKISRTLVSKVFKEGKTILTTDASQDPRLKTAQSVVGLKLKSLLCCPLRRRSEAIGVIYLENRFQKGVFEETMVEILESFADQAAIAVENAQLRDEDRRKALHIQKLNEELEKSLARKTLELEEISRRLEASRWELQRQYSYENIVGASPSMQNVFSMIERLKEREVTVLIHGESGTGKELIARALHFGGPRQKGEFVAINCAAIPEHLLESELFGSTRGAYTGADRDRAGLIEQAQGGTLFLDEIGDMPLTMQAKLLRVLQEREVRRVGSSSRITVDVRFISATNKDLAALVKQKKFREDLFYRINPVTIHLPALRERKEDIPLLINHLLRKLCPDSERHLSRQALEALIHYDWPGNIRELVNELERAVSLSDQTIGPEHLSDKLLTFLGLETSGAFSTGLKGSRQSLEKTLILKTLEECGGNKSLAAQKLGLSRVALYQKIKKYELSLAR